MTKWVVVFFGMAALDYIWAKYTHAVTARRAHLAALLSMVIMACNVTVTVSYIHDIWLVIPTMLGAWLGTFIAVQRS
jgi:hypothetical protein